MKSVFSIEISQYRFSETIEVSKEKNPENKNREKHMMTDHKNIIIKPTNS